MQVQIEMNNRDSMHSINPAHGITSNSTSGKEREDHGEAVTTLTPDRAADANDSCCCQCARILCCNSDEDPSAIILRTERERLSQHLQPLEDEQDLCGRQNCKTIAVDVLLCPLGCKQPKSCSSKCNQHRGFTYVFRLWQLAVLISVWLFDLPFPGIFPGGTIRQFNILLCTHYTNNTLHSSGLTRQFPPVHCPSVQHVLRTSNFTKDTIGYPGAIKTMQALNYTDTFDKFILYRAETRSKLPAAGSAATDVIFGLFLMSCYVSFGLQDVNEFMYPARLEIKIHVARSDQTVEYHFIRPRNLLTEIVIWVVVSIEMLLLWIGSISSPINSVEDVFKRSASY